MKEAKYCMPNSVMIGKGQGGYQSPPKSQIPYKLWFRVNFFKETKVMVFAITGVLYSQKY